MRLFVFTWLLYCALAYNVEKLKEDGLAKARVELNRMREVKAFVNQDIPLYHNLVMKHIPGADPELVLLNHYYHELDRIDLSDMTRSEINELLGELGFYKKAQPEEEVPEEFRFAPAKDSPFEDLPESQSTSPPTEKTSSESQSTSSPTEKTSSESQSTAPPTEKTSSESQSTSPPTENTSEPEAMRSEL